MGGDLTVTSIYGQGTLPPCGLPSVVAERSAGADGQRPTIEPLPGPGGLSPPHRAPVTRIYRAS